MRWGLLLAGCMALIVVVFATWVTGCDENPDCGGVSLIAFYALWPLLVGWLLLALGLVVRRVRRGRS